MPLITPAMIQWAELNVDSEQATVDHCYRSGNPTWKAERCHAAAQARLALLKELAAKEQATALGKVEIVDGMVFIALDEGVTVTDGELVYRRS